MNLAQRTVWAIVTLPTTYLMEVCTYFIGWDTEHKGKKRLRLGLGPAEYFQLCRQQLQTAADTDSQANPFKALLLKEDFPQEYLTDKALQVMAEGMLVIQFGHELYNELAVLLRRNRFRVKNSGIALESLTLKTFRSIVVPFVTSNAETLRRLNLLPTGFWDRYIEFRRLSKQFGAFAQDPRLPRKQQPAATNPTLHLLPKPLLACLQTCSKTLKNLAGLDPAA